MNKITFVTTNRGKIESLKKRLPKNVELEVVSIPLPEIQAESGSDVVTLKAVEAFKILNRPLIIQDSSFHLTAYNGFPGANIKYVLAKLGIEGLLAIMKDKGDRTAYFENAIGYTEDGVKVTTFVSQNHGKLTYEIDDTNKEHSWSDLWKIFIPEGSTKTLASISKEELEDLKKTPHHEKSCFTQFSEWIMRD